MNKNTDVSDSIRQYIFIQTNKRDVKYTQKSLAFFAKSNKEEEKVTETKAASVNNPEAVISSAAEESKGQEIKIWHWNVNGIRAVLNSNKFQEFVKKGKTE